jgi:tetratricopeptide (TPR) repeat protein
MSTSAKSAIHFSIALLLLLGFGQSAQGTFSIPVKMVPASQQLTLSEAFTALGIQVAGSPNPKPAEALFARAIQIAEAMPVLTEQTQALLTIASRLRQVNQTSRSQKLVERVMGLTMEYAAKPVKESYEQDGKQRELAIISGQLAEAGEVDRALQLANTKIPIKLRKGQALNGIAAAIARQGNTKKAQELLNEAVRSVKGDRVDYVYESNGSCGNEKFAVFAEIAKTLSLVSELDQALEVAETLWGCHSASGDSAQQYQAWAYLGILSHLGTVEQLQRTWNSAKRMPQAPNIVADPVERIMTWYGIADKLIDVGEIPLVLSIATQISIASKLKDNGGMSINPDYPLQLGQENLQNIALKLAQKQKLEAALQVTQLLADAPARQDIVRREIAGQLARARQLDKALQVAASVADRTMETRSKLAIVQNLQKIGLTTPANALFETLIPALSPETAPELVAIGQSDLALKLLDKLDGKLDKNGRVLAETALQFVELKQLEPALKLADHIKNDEIRHPLLLAIVEQQVKLGQLDQALVLALSLKKSNVWGLSTKRDQLLASIAMGFGRSGQLAKARQVAEAVSEELAKVALLSDLAIQK